MLKSIFNLILKCAIVTILISAFTLGLLSFLWGLDHANKHKYTFTSFSIRLVSFSYFITSVVLLIATLTGLSLSGNSENNKKYFIFNASLLIGVTLLLTIGTFGLVSISNKQIDLNVRNLMLDAFEKYNETQQNQHETKKFNWLHRKYFCCGIKSHEDWKLKKNLTSILEELDFDLKIDLVEDIPDSCCLEENLNCGKKYMSNKLDFIFTRNCFEEYLKVLTEDLEYLCRLAIHFSLAVLIADFFANAALLFQRYEYTKITEE